MKDLSERWDSAMRSVSAHFCPELNQNEGTDLSRIRPDFLEINTLKHLSLSASRQFVLLTAPSGTGKGTIGRILEKNGVYRMPRTTTRRRRIGESDSDYHFVSQDDYDKMLIANKFLCPTDQTTSGDSCSAIERKNFLYAIRSGRPFYIDSGSGTPRQIRNEPEVAALNFAIIFILPPTFGELVRRIKGRDESMNEDIINKRLFIATEHLLQSVFYTDLFVVNDDSERAAKQIMRLFGRV